MNPPTPKSASVPGDGNESPASSFQSIVHKSALLNLVIVLTSFPALVLAGGPKAVVPSLAIMVGITFLIWTATFGLFSVVSIGRIFWMVFSAGSRPTKLPDRMKQAGVADRWLDGPG